MSEWPSYGIFAKKDVLYERGRELNWQVSGSGGAATTVSESENNEGPSVHKRPLITRAKEYATATIDREDLVATKGDPKRIIEVYQLAVSNAIRGIKRSFGTHLFRDGTGIKAQLKTSASGTGTATVTLQNALDAALFESGDWVQATDKTSGNLASAGAKIQLTGRNIGAGQLIAGGNWTASIANITDGYYLLRSGDYNNVIKGLGAWVPAVSPTTGDSFFGLDRSSIGEGAFGHRPTSNSSNLMSIGMDAMAYMHSVTGSGVDVWFVNPLDFNALAKDLIGLEQIVIPAQGVNGKRGEIGYKAARFQGPQGVCELVPDPLCPRGSSWMGNRETAEWWTMESMIEQITLGMGEGNGFVVRGQDAIAIRFAGFAQFVVKQPWQWAYVALPTG